MFGGLDKIGSLISIVINSGVVILVVVEVGGL